MKTMSFGARSHEREIEIDKKRIKEIKYGESQRQRDKERRRGEKAFQEEARSLPNMAKKSTHHTIAKRAQSLGQAYDPINFRCVKKYDKIRKGREKAGRERAGDRHTKPRWALRRDS